MEEQEGEENVGMLVLEAKSLRPFRTKDEYLYAMKEDLAEWFTCLYKEICLNADNFLEILETGVLLCQHANEVRKFAQEQKSKGTFAIQSNFVRDIQIPESNVQFRMDVKPGTFLARDNISNFITWTSKMGIPEVLRFETDDLVMRKNERSVVLCLLEVARVGAKFGMIAPTIVQMEEEIDKEIETGEPPPQIKTCDVKSLDEMVRELVGRCTCPVQFPIIKVGEGKYKIGDNQTLVFVRILRKHVMIRVGGGWDTLEHYLDRHDPCRCGFQGHRGGGRGVTTPRRGSTTVSKSLPGTPKTSRKLSLTTQNSSTHSGSTARPASPSMRSASPGPNARKLSLTGKGAVPQPAQSVTSPNITQKKPNFSNSGQTGNIQTKTLNGSSSSGNFPVGSFVKQSQMNLTRQLSSSSTGSQSVATGARRSESPAPRPQSPGQRRSESPAPVIANRLRSPSPAPMLQKGSNQVRPQSVPATQRCSSPVKQITMAELRSSREGKVNAQPSTPITPRTSRDGKLTSQQTTKTLRRQTSTDSNKSRDSEAGAMAEPGSSNFAIDKISTMSLGEFRNLLNSALAVPNGNNESQCSSDSPRSQGSVDSGRNVSSKQKSTPTKSAYSYRSVSASRTQTSKPSVTSKPGVQSKTRSNSITPRTSQEAQSNVTIYSRPASAKNNYRSVPSSGYGQERPKTPNTMPRSRSNTSTVSDSSFTLQSSNRSTFASRSSSHSSIQSCESTDDGRNSFGTDYADQNSKVLTPSSVDSDYSFRGSSGTGSDYTRSNSYTPCSAIEEKLRLEKLQANARASSEPRENISSISKDIQNAYGIPESKPKNVGYATFSYDKEDDPKESDEMNEIDNEIIKSRDKSDENFKDMNEVSNSGNQSSSQSNVRPQTPSGRQTPSFIPRPITPKVSRKLSLPQNDESEQVQSYDDRKAAARPPTPKRSNIIARAHGPSGARSADKSKEQSYRELFQKRSTTPGPGSSSSNSASNARRSMTPGPYLNKSSTLRPTSATTNRARLNEAIGESKGATLSIYNDNKENSNISSAKRTQVIDKKSLVKQKSLDQSDTVIVVNVDRSEGRHSLSVQGENEPRHSANKPKVLARARTEENRSRPGTRTPTGVTRQRPQSVEPRQLISRKGTSKDTEVALTVKRNENGQHGIYDRTQEWVQTAVEQTKVVQKTKVNRTYTPRMRRAMTPNSFDMRIDQENEEPRTLEEIKAALTLPINGLNEINPDTLEAPPEDPEMYATMEKLFHELRQQELKNSVNETPGSNSIGSKATRSKSSKSNSSNNDEEMSLDSNRNIKTKTLSVSTKSSSNVTSPSMQRSSKINVNSNQTPRGQSLSRTSSSSSANVSQLSNSQSVQGNQYNKKESPSPSRQTGPVSTQRSSRPSSPGPSARRPPSPRTTTPRPASPRVSSQPPRPASPRVNSQPPRPASPRVSPHTSRPASPAFKTNSDSSRGSTPSRSQPPRPASTPPRPYSPVTRQSSKSSEDNDNVFEKEKKSDSGSIMKKIKEMIKVNPRKDKADGVKGKSKIPAPKSLASVGKSRSFTNLSNMSKSFSLSSEDGDGYALDDSNTNGYGEHINGGLNVTLSGRSENPKPKLSNPLITGRSSLIRKESMEKNKNNVSNRLVRAVSVERNMSGLNNNTYHFYDDGEYV